MPIHVGESLVSVKSSLCGQNKRVLLPIGHPCFCTKQTVKHEPRIEQTCIYYKWPRILLIVVSSLYNNWHPMLYSWWTMMCECRVQHWRQDFKHGLDFRKPWWATILDWRPLLVLRLIQENMSIMDGQQSFYKGPLTLYWQRHPFCTNTISKSTRTGRTILLKFCNTWTTTWTVKTWQCRYLWQTIPEQRMELHPIPFMWKDLFRTRVCLAALVLDRATWPHDRNVWRIYRESTKSMDGEYHYPMKTAWWNNHGCIIILAFGGSTVRAISLSGLRLATSCHSIMYNFYYY